MTTRQRQVWTWSAVAFVAAVVGGIALGIWSVLELFVFFDGNFRR